MKIHHHLFATHLLSILLILLTKFYCISSDFQKNYCRDVIYSSVDYEIIFQQGHSEYVKGNHVKAKIDLLCATRASTTVRFRAYLLLGMIYKDDKKYLSTARYCFLKSLLRTSSVEDEILALNQIADIYDAWNHTYGTMLYRELAVLRIHQKQMNSSKSIPLLSKEFDSINIDMYSILSMPYELLQKLSSSSYSLILPYYFSMARSHQSDYLFHRPSTYELFVHFLHWRSIAYSFTSDTIQIANLLPPFQLKQVPAVHWSPGKPIKILFDDIYGDAVFAETVQGLVGALERLRVPCKVVTYVASADEESLYIIMFASAEAIKAKNFIFWNFEKNPSLVRPNEQVGLKHFENDYLETAVLPYDVIRNALGIWDYSETHLELWDTIFASIGSRPPAGVHIIRPLIEVDVVAEALVNTLVVSSSSEDSSSEHDELLPIDIIFFGSVNPHRQYVYDGFTQLAYEHGLRVEFHRNTYGAQRNSLMDSAKIILNLANHPFPHDTGSLRRSAVNMHRLMYPLARGKVVLSERCGLSVDEDAFKGSVVFADTKDLFSAALYLLNNVEIRRSIEEKAVLFVAEDLDLILPTSSDVRLSTHSSVSSMSKLADALRVARDGIPHLFQTHHPQSHCQLQRWGRSSTGTTATADTAAADTYGSLVTDFLHSEWVSRYRTRERIDTDVVSSRDSRAQLSGAAVSAVDVSFIASYLADILECESTLEVGCLYPIDVSSPNPTTRVCNSSSSSVHTNRASKFCLAVIRYSAESFPTDFQFVVSVVSTDGIILVHHSCKISCSRDDIGPGLRPWYLGDALKVIGTHRDLSTDVALVDVDWGVLVVRVDMGVTAYQPKHHTVPDHSAASPSPLTVDRHMPVLSFCELVDHHVWMKAALQEKGSRQSENAEVLRA